MGSNMEHSFSIRFYSPAGNKRIEITNCTLDEAVAFAIIIFDKYARKSGDSIIVYDEDEKMPKRLFNLSDSNKMRLLSL